MATFVIETYLPRTRGGGLEASTARLREAIDRSPPGVLRARHVRSFYVADDEIAYHIVDAESQAAAEELAREAGVIPERIVEASSPSG